MTVKYGSNVRLSVMYTTVELFEQKHYHWQARQYTSSSEVLQLFPRTQCSSDP